jgi:hypothetical protein
MVLHMQTLDKPGEELQFIAVSNLTIKINIFFSCLYVKCLETSLKLKQR